MKLSRSLLLSSAAACCALLAPAAAHAAVVTIDGDPLDVFLGDTGRLQARFPDATGGQFFPPSSDEGSSGFQLGVDLQAQPDGGAGMLGFNNTQWTAGGQNPVTGSGTNADPFRQVSTFTGTTPTTQQPITVVQTTDYVNGTGFFRLRWDITNSGTTPTVVRPTLAADLYAGGSDSGTGFLENGPPRVVGGLASTGEGTGGIVELTPWAAFEEDGFGTVFSHVRDFAPGGGLDNSINPESVDNGAGVAGFDATICATNCSSATTTFESGWRFANFISLTPAVASNATGTRHTVEVKLTNTDGSARPGVAIGFTISGPNSGQGSVPTGGDGIARITWTGTNPGTDTLSVFADLNGNGTQDFGAEPQRQATVEWLAPVPGQTAVVEPVRGTVLVRLPPGASPARYGLREEARQAQAGFIPLTGAASLPVRSIVNANRGELSLSSARDLRGRTQTANFYSGTFQFLQKRAARPITEIALKGGSFRRCPRASRSSTGDGPEADASQRRSRGRRVRRVWGNGRGNFRTRGRYSSATVRGTTWLTQDNCGGTLTRVGRRPRSSRVVVRDFVRRRSVTLRAGRSYFAFARRAK